MEERHTRFALLSMSNRELWPWPCLLSIVLVRFFVLSNLMTVVDVNVWNGTHGSQHAPPGHQPSKERVLPGRSKPVVGPIAAFVTFEGGTERTPADVWPRHSKRTPSGCSQASFGYRNRGVGAW